VKKIAIISIFLVLLFSKNAMAIRDVKPGYSLDKAKGKSLVFGRISLALPKGGNCQLRFNNIETRKYYEIEVIDGPMYYKSKKKGKKWDGLVERYFFIELAPGDYFIKLLKITSMGFGNMYGSDINPKINFSIPSNSIVYIGTLSYSFDQEHDHFFIRSGKGYISILDEHEEAIRELRMRYPAVKEEVDIKLMDIEEQDQRDDAVEEVDQEYLHL